MARAASRIGGTGPRSSEGSLLRGTKRMGTIIGIDLGTTNSCVSIVKDGRPRVIEDERGYNILPSCVAFKSRGRFVVGHGAKALILTNPTQTLYAIKRLVGRKFSSAEVQEAKKHLSYDIIQGEGDEILLRMDDAVITPVEASSIILKAIKDIAERHIGEEVSDAIITVPAHFSHSQRKGTMDAGEMAGLNVLRLLNEPTAAALAYGFKKDFRKKLAIYDLGGGTFDVTVLEAGDGVYEILSTGGDSFLGGEDFDYRVVNYLADRFLEKHQVDLRQDKMALQRLKDAAERAKCELSFVDRTPVLIPRVHGSLNLEATLTRDLLEELVSDLINKTLKLTARTMQEAGLSVDDLDDIIIVGGQTRMPRIQEQIRVFFGRAPCKGVHPEEVVAIGAAVHGYSLEDETESTLLLDVTPFSMGIDSAGEFFTRIIDKNATVPLNMARTFTTVSDNQESVKIVIRQGESRLSRENELLGEFRLEGIRPAPKMTPRIDVGFKIDASGILHVSAVDRDTGAQQAITIRNFVEAGSRETTGVQIPREISEVSVVGGTSQSVPVAASAAGASGVFSKLKSLFGSRARGKNGAPGIPEAATFQGVDPAAASPGMSDFSVQERSPSRTPQPAASLRASSPPDYPVRERSPSESAARSRPPAPIDDEIAADLRESLDSYFDGGKGEETGQALFTAGEEGDIAPLDDSWISPPGDEGGEDLGVFATGETSYDVTPRGAAAPGRQGASPHPVAAPANRPTPVRQDSPPSGWDEAVIPLDEVTQPFMGIPDQSFAEAVPSLEDYLGVAPRVVAPPPRRSVPAFGQDSRSLTPQEDTLPSPDRPADLLAAAAAEAARGMGRKPARLKIRYKRAKTFVEELTENLARGGTFVKTEKPLDVGRECVFEVYVPGTEDMVEVRGKVVWSSKGLPALGVGQEVGMGVQYDRQDEGGLGRLKDAVDSVRQSEAMSPA